MAKRKGRYLGIDIGDHSIKAVEVEGYDAQNWAVTSVGVAPTPDDAVADGVVAQPDALSNTIRDLLRHNGMQSHQAVCSVSGPAVHFRPLRLPRMNDTQIRKAVLFKARETPTATPLEEMVVEYDVQDPDPTMTDLDILMVAAPRAIVESRADAVRDAGLIVEAVDLEGFALMRALVECSPDRSILQKTVAIVSLGHTFTEFNIVTRGSFSFPRSIPIGGSHFNHTLQNSLGLEPKAVEEMKHFLDLRSLLSVDVASGNTTPEQMLRPGMDELVREITRSINYYQSQFAEGANETNIDQLLLCGGGARMTGMKEYVAARLRLDVEVADPLDSFFAANLSPEIDLVRDYAPALVCALGLALYCLAPK